MGDPTGAALSVRQCNVSVSRKKARCKRPHYPVEDALYFFHNWENLQGFIGMGTAYFIHLVALMQCSFGVLGAIGEIGVAGGKSFAALAFTRRENEALVACDLFAMGIEKDNVPDANLPLFLDVLESVNIPAEDVQILQQSSLQLRDCDLVGLALGRRRSSGVLASPERVGPFRLFHVDGGHYAEAALHDLNSAACALVPGGVVLVDDLHNMGWPGVQEGFHRYMLHEPAPRRLVPFLYTGRLFLTTPGYASRYRRTILRMHPQLRSVTLYETEMIAAPPHVFPVRVEDFERLLIQGLPKLHG